MTEEEILPMLKEAYLKVKYLKEDLSLAETELNKLQYQIYELGEKVCLE